MAAGKITLQAADGKTLSLVAPEGMVANTTDVVATKVEVDTKAPLASPAFTGTPTVNGVAFGGYSGFKNYIINGNFDVWQRGTSQTVFDYGSDDRWNNWHQGLTKTHSQVACTDTERALFNASYFSRTVVAYNSGGWCGKAQKIENVTSLAGKTITVSFWAKADSNKNIRIEYAQYFGSGGTPSAYIEPTNSQTISLTTIWQKKTVTVTLPSIVGKTIGTDGVHTSSTQLNFIFSGDGLEQSGTFDIAQVQLEEGLVATPFEQRPYGLELSLCQRYYEKFTAEAGATTTFGFGDIEATASASFLLNYQQKRIAPTLSASGAFSIRNGGINVPATVSFTSTTKFNTIITAVASGLTTGYGSRVFASDPTAIITASAEL